MSGPLVSISHTLAIKQIQRVVGLEAFQSTHLWTPWGARGVFGGQVVAQSLMAAAKTVEGKDLHSQHCYFLLPANSKEPITFTVERLRDGKSYATRLVHALQNSQTVFILMASFTAPPITIPDEFKTAASALGKPVDKPADQSHAHDHDDHHSDSGNGNGEGRSSSVNDDPMLVGTLKFTHSAIPPFSPRFQLPFPEDITPWGKAEIEEDRWTMFLRTANERGIDTAKGIQSYIKERMQSPVTIAIARQQAGQWGNTRGIWLKPRLDEGEVLDPNTVRAMFGYLTDFQFIGTAGKTVGLSGRSHPKLSMMASLDHTTHYYPFPPDFDQRAPLLHLMEATLVDVASGRGLVRGRLYTEKGVLLATTSQEGVVRADFGTGKRPRKEHERNNGKAKL